MPKKFFPGEDRTELSVLQRMRFRNDAGSQAPAFGILRVTGFVADAEEPYVTVGQPNTYGSQHSHAINDEVPVEPGKFGLCTLGLTVPALYDSADGTPAFGESWGPRASTWKLKKNTGGFRVLGVTDSANHLVLVAQEPFLNFRGTANAAIAADTRGTASIFCRSGDTAYTDTTVDTPTNGVLNDLDVEVPSGATIECRFDPYVTGGTWTESWRIVQSDFECEE